MDHRAASPPHRISHAGRGVLGTGRHRARQRQLVRPQAQAVRSRHRGHARPPPYRLDRRGEDHLGPVTGNGRNRRRADAFLYPYASGRPRRAAPPACARAGGDRRRGDGICQLKLAGLFAVKSIRAREGRLTQPPLQLPV
jgi:hypothetical protein